MPYWEKLEFNCDCNILVLTGKKGDKCMCAFAGCPDPPCSLCLYRCKKFQEEIFGMLLARKVEVKITASFLLGHDRCSTKIHLA